MRTATALTLLAIGAILTFAVTAHPRFLNLQVAGLVIMAVGAAGLLLRGRGYNWVRRRIVLRKGTNGPVIGHIDEASSPSYVTIDPETRESAQPIAEQHETDLPFVTEDQVTERVVTRGRTSADSVVVEEYVEE